MKRFWLAPLLLCAAPALAAAGEVAIVPSLIEAGVSPGDDATTVVQIVYTKDGPDDNDPIRIVLSTEDWDVDRQGRVSFSAEGPGPESVRPWLAFSPGELEILPGESMLVRVSVIVPPRSTSTSVPQ